MNEPSDCTGAYECPASVHVHGCYADRGSCNEPEEHLIGFDPKNRIDFLEAAVRNLEWDKKIRSQAVREKQARVMELEHLCDILYDYIKDHAGFAGVPKWIRDKFNETMK